MSNLEQTNNTYAYEFGGHFTVVMLDISTEERKEAVSRALENVIDNVYGGTRDGVQPYKNLLEDTKSSNNYVHAFEGHLECLKYALAHSPSEDGLCKKMFDEVKFAEHMSKEGEVVIDGINCRQCSRINTWEDKSGITYTVGQSVDDPSFYYVRASDEIITRDYEYDHEPTKEEVMSRHADKLAEEAIDLGEAEHGADGYAAFPNPEESEVRAENIRRMQDISHNLTNADPSAKRGERQNTMENKNFTERSEAQEFVSGGGANAAAQQEEKENALRTSFIVSSMTVLNADDSAANPKAIASVAINNELIVSGITLNQKEDGTFSVHMPRTKNRDGEYEDRVYPASKEASKALRDAVKEAYKELKEQGLDNKHIDIKPPEKPQSKIKASLKKSENENSRVKATGKIIVDDCFVVNGITVSDKVNTETGELSQSVKLPHFKQDKNGLYPAVALPVTKSMYAKIKDVVLESYNAKTRGIGFPELGGAKDTATYFRQNNDFADKVMNKLDEQGIPYHARISQTTTLSVKNSDKAEVEGIRNEIRDAARKPSTIGDINKIKAEQKAKEAEQPAREQPTKQAAKSKAQEL